MSDSDCITQVLMFSRPVELRAEIDSYLLDEGVDGIHPILGYRLSFFLGERRLCSDDFPLDAGKVLVEGGVLEDPVRLALRAITAPEAEDGWVRVTLRAVPTTPWQEARLQDAERSLPGGIALMDLPEDQVGVWLGELRFPADSESLRGVPLGPDLEVRLAGLRRALQPFFDRVLYGDPAQEVERLLGSTR